MEDILVRSRNKLIDASYVANSPTVTVSCCRGPAQSNLNPTNLDFDLPVEGDIGAVGVEVIDRRPVNRVDTLRRCRVALSHPSHSYRTIV